MQKILLIDKPKGITSFDVIRILRKKLGIRKMGHAGTLDPLASGLLIVAVGDATKELANFLKLPKSYRAEILFGVKTDTADVDGKVLESYEVNLDNGKIEEAVSGIKGDWQLPVPMYSAIKKHGRPLYAYAREGIVIEPILKPMSVFDAKLLDIKHNCADIILNVSSGTYIRSLAEELGRRLGTFGCIKNLRRLSIGEFKVEDSKPPEQIEL